MTSRNATFYCSKTAHFVFILYTIARIWWLQFWHRFDHAASTIIIFTKCPPHTYRCRRLVSTNICQFVIRCVTEGRGWWKNSFLLNFTHALYEWVFPILQASHSALAYEQENTFPHINAIYMVAGRKYVLRSGISFYARLYGG